MSTSVDQTFTRQYEAEVHQAYQRTGSMLRSTVRIKNGVVGDRTQFPVIGKGVAGEKTRHGLVPVMNLDHTPVECTISDKYAGEWIDNLDELKTNIDERGETANAAAYALGRATDDLIVTALNGGTQTQAMTLTNESTARNSILLAGTTLHNGDVPDDGNIFCAISPHFWSMLMTIKEFANADYVGEDLPYAGRQRGMKTWDGKHWFRFTGLSGIGATSTSFMYHRRAIGHAIQKDVSTDITWHGDRAAHFVANCLAMGSCLIDNTGVVKMTLDETAALPTAA